MDLFKVSVSFPYVLHDIIKLGISSYSNLKKLLISTLELLHLILQMVTTTDMYFYR